MFTIRPRRAWGAVAPNGTPIKQHRNFVRTLVVHHTAGQRHTTYENARQEMRNIQRQHQGQGWADIGYHFVIDGSGRVWEGRDIDSVGAHTYLHNSGTLGVSFMGNYEHQRLSARQLTAYAALRLRLRAKGFRIQTIKGHRQMPDNATACPGRNVMRALGL